MQVTAEGSNRDSIVYIINLLDEAIDNIYISKVFSTKFIHKASLLYLQSILLLYPVDLSDWNLLKLDIYSKKQQHGTKFNEWQRIYLTVKPQEGSDSPIKMPEVR